ncbi:hypothetical protein [Bacillus sp. B1-b2]|uniref:hypothetical protein n=1 Tax=Bacillus sp. B1-b2 TaxID=2653201 RepID=UPI001261D6E8|nr:hypothetical protein [Bacillus sp. B1-b2]KAB7668663.1 hypothetical protein F9279_12580 [Bacillus sp. B1-b2]
MSLKAIEMQIALPRTMDAGKIQEQQDHKSQHMYHLAGQELRKEEERKRTAVIKGEAQTPLQWRKQKDNEFVNLQKKRSEDETKQESSTFKHPYKGNSIDFSG